ncbi:unnamed protein product [Sphagnum balticum]
MKARRCKLPRPGTMAMADCEENSPNGRLPQSRLWTSRQKSGRARPKARVICTPIRYLRKEILPILASQKSFLYLLVSEGARRPRRSPLPGKRRGTASPPPGEKLRKQETLSERMRPIQ